MKKVQKLTILLLFFVYFLVNNIFFCFFSAKNKDGSIDICSATSLNLTGAEIQDVKLKSESLFVTNCFKNKNFYNLDWKNLDRQYTFFYNKKKYTYKLSEFYNQLSLSPKQQELFSNELEQKQIIPFLENLGLSKKDICFYLRPELKLILEKIESQINKSPQDDFVQVIKNECKINFKYGDSGRFINQEKLFDKIYDEIKLNKKEISTALFVEPYKIKHDIESQFMEKGCFSTNFSSSSDARKNNIKVALSCFDGLVLDAGETMSFNSVTGVRNKESGYMAAKIITGGTYVEGYGGGVCQVSTTLYNAALLSDLEILEVHSHSLPVGYVEPSFDAMVNIGTSDLVIRNNTSGKIIITTSYRNDICKVKIFGEKNRYKITRISEKVRVIPADEEIIDTDYKKFGIEDMQVGEQRRISYSKDGYYSYGYLNYYDIDGTLVETRKIRENKYSATKGVVVKREI